MNQSYTHTKFKQRKIARGVRLSPKNDQALIKHCKKVGKTPSQMIDDIITSYFNK